MARYLLVLVLLSLACTSVAVPVPPAGSASTDPLAAQPQAPFASRSSGSTKGIDEPVNFTTAGWKTDFSRRSVPFSEIMSGGPPRDGIPPIDRPTFASFAQADPWLKEQEPVIALALGGEARAYPLQVLIWHEIVNDEVAGVPVAVTFCPLCNTAIAFDRRLQPLGTLRFGTTGNLRHSDLVMWDDKTESWWQQITGEAIVGELTGTSLAMLPASTVSYSVFKQSYPRGVVLSRGTGFSRSYGSNPYVGYDDVSQAPFLFRGPTDGRLPPMERVVTVELNGETAAYPFSVLRQRGIAEDLVGGQPVVVFWASGTASALDGPSIAGSRDVGATGVFSPVLGGQRLRFALQDGAIVDGEYGSTWNVLGRGIGGPLEGQELQPVVHANHFWFSWVVFKPETRVFQ